jgi:hypothetical protein
MICNNEKHAGKIGLLIYKDECVACVFEERDNLKQSPQAGREAGSGCMKLLSAIRDHDEVGIVGADIAQGSARDPRYKLLLRGPKHLLAKLFYAIAKGEGI